MGDVSGFDCSYHLCLSLLSCISLLVYLTELTQVHKLSIRSIASNRKMIMNDKLGRMWKAIFSPILSYCHRI